MNDHSTRPPSIVTAVAANPARSVVVRATEHSVPVDIRIEQGEVRYGGARLAAQILALCERAGLEASAVRRLEWEEAGVPASVLDALGLATREQVAQVDAAKDHHRPSTWMRAL